MKLENVEVKQWQKKKVEYKKNMFESQTKVMVKMCSFNSKLIANPDL